MQAQWGAIGKSFSNCRRPLVDQGVQKPSGQQYLITRHGGREYSARLRNFS